MAKIDFIRKVLEIAEAANVNITLKAEELRPVVEAVERLEAENARLEDYLKASTELCNIREEQLRGEIAEVGKLQAKNAQLRAALEQVEWVDMVYKVRRGKYLEEEIDTCCPWCKRSDTGGHTPDCPRQKALEE